MTSRRWTPGAPGYEVYQVVDAIGGTSAEAHRAASERVGQAGAKPVSWTQVICELQRDWARTETVPTFNETPFGRRLPSAMRHSPPPPDTGGHDGA